jgi:hypothetical protein
MAYRGDFFWYRQVYVNDDRGDFYSFLTYAENGIYVPHLKTKYLNDPSLA